MSESTSTEKKTMPKYKSCLINAIIFVVSMVLMLTMAEGFMRWMDGYQLSSVDLEHKPATVQPVEKGGQ